MSFGKDGDPFDVLSEGEFEQRISKSRDNSHIKFLEMLCILENAILELETQEDKQSKETYDRLSELRNDFLEKREVMHMLVDSIFQLDKEIKSMHFQDSNQLKCEIEEAKRDYMQSQKSFEEVTKARK